MTRRGRPRTGSLLSVEDVFAAITERLVVELPTSCADIASDLGTNRRTLTDVIARDTGLAWADFIYRISRTAETADADDDGMKRITVSLDDATFDQLRQVALSEMRDPRLEARRILERALSRRRPAAAMGDSPERAA